MKAFRTAKNTKLCRDCPFGAVSMLWRLLASYISILAHSDQQIVSTRESCMDKCIFSPNLQSGEKGLWRNYEWARSGEQTLSTFCLIQICSRTSVDRLSTFRNSPKLAEGNKIGCAVLHRLPLHRKWCWLSATNLRSCARTYCNFSSQKNWIRTRDFWEKTAKFEKSTWVEHDFCPFKSAFSLSWRVANSGSGLSSSESEKYEKRNLSSNSRTGFGPSNWPSS